MSALLLAVVVAALIIAGVITGALRWVQYGNAVVTAEMKRLGSEMQQQAKIVDQLNASPHAGSCDAKQLQKELHRLDLQYSELKTQVQAELQANQLLQRLSGVVCELRAQLQVSVQGSAQLQQHSVDINTLRAQLQTRSNDPRELSRQAGVIEELKTHLGMSAERQREITRQASILDDLKAQLSVSNELNVELMFRRSSLEEARALITHALKTQQGADTPGSSTMSFTRMQRPDMQVRKPGLYVKPKLPTHLASQRASVAMPSAGWDPAKHFFTSPNAELNADLTSLEDITSVSELGIECESGSERLTYRGTSMTRPTPRLASGLMLSPFASQLYQIPKDLQVQLDSVGFAEVDQPMRSKHQDKGASVAVETPQASDSGVSLGGLPICRSLTRRKSVPNRAPAPRCAQPPSREGPANGNPVAAAAAAAAMSFNHGQCSRRQSRLMTLSSVSTTQTGMRPYAHESLRQEDHRSDGKVALRYNSDHSTAPTVAGAEMKVQKSSGKLSRAMDGAMGLLSPHIKKKQKA